MSQEPRAKSQSASYTNTPCDLCEGEKVEELSQKDRDGSYLRTVICQHCGLVYSDPRPTSEELREYYEKLYRLDYKSSFQPKPKHIFRAGKVAVNRFRKILPNLQPKCRILDVGAGGGEVVYVLRAMGYEARGIEPNEGYAQFASTVLGLPIEHAFYLNAHIEVSSLDFITMFHVVEHFESPYKALCYVRKWLRPDGRLFVEVPNIEARCQSPSNTFHRAHIYNFSPATLRMLGRKAGYEVLSTSVSTDGGNISVLLQKSENPIPPSFVIPGNYDHVRGILRTHTTFRHLLSPFPYLRPFSKLKSRVDEWLGTKNKAPHAILDRLISSQLNVTPH
jgi:2-polyprenyl-3-methyl-5-hydroxy-6-metoxy-1,4-benzoquinol methylase